MADYEIPSFLKKKDLAVLYNGAEGSELVFYIPESYFISKVASIDGEYLNTLGVFNYSIFDKNGKSTIGLRNFRFPAAFLSKPSKITKESNIKLTSESPIIDYRIAHFNNGDEVVHSVKVPQMIENVENFFKLSFITSHIPTTIPYDDIFTYPDEAMELSGNKFGINIQMFGMIYGEILKDQDGETPYRLTKKLDKSQTGYMYSNVIKNPKHNGPFISITSQNFDEAVMGAILSNDNPKETPLEKILIR